MLSRRFDFAVTAAVLDERSSSSRSDLGCARGATKVRQ
jgi:hypothetical protein